MKLLLQTPPYKDMTSYLIGNATVRAPLLFSFLLFFHSFISFRLLNLRMSEI